MDLLDSMTISIETGVQSFTLGIAIALAFDRVNEPRLVAELFRVSVMAAAVYPMHCLWMTLLFKYLNPPKETKDLQVRKAMAGCDVTGVVLAPGSGWYHKMGAEQDLCESAFRELQAKSPREAE